jgi:hypothetical protein
LLIAICIINGFDLALTKLAHMNGLLQESNPIARAVLSYGVGAVALFKIGIVALSSAILYRYRDRLCAEMAAGFVLITYLGLAIRWRLCYEMYDITLSAGDAQVDWARFGGWSQAFLAF